MADKIEDTLSACCGSIGYMMPYLNGRYPAHYPVPARIVTFEYWPASQTDNGKPAVYGHDHYKPGRWLEFLEVN